MLEEWKDIEGYEGLYQVSNFGRVRSFTKNKDGYILNPIDNKLGYFRVSLWNKRGIEKRWRVNRLVALMFIPNPNNYNEVNHIDCNTKNNTVLNLEWCDHSYNVKHSYLIHKHQQRGEDNSTHKLTCEEVLEIYELSHTLKRQGKEIAAKYGISNVTVSAIKTGRLWTHLTQNEEIHA